MANNDESLIAELHLQDNKLTIYYGDYYRDITLDMKSEEHSAVAKTVLDDPNFWANFLNSFSTAINNHVEAR